MNFVQVWLTGYVNPARMIDLLKAKPAPQWGFFAVLLRGLMDALLLYLPIYLLGRKPPTPSYLTFISTDQYYLALVFFSPLYFLALWLFLSAVLHLTLRFLGRPSSFDQILNIEGMASLVVGAFLVPWDWVWLLLGWHDQVWLGISHLLLVVWGMVLAAMGLERILQVPVRLGFSLQILWVLLGLPLAILFMRSPV